MISPKQAFELYDVGIDCSHDYTFVSSFLGLDRY